MAMRSAFNMHHSNLQDFLSTPVWEEENGTTLNMLSALARLDLDPWREAARLADMPRSSAAAALASILERLPADHLKSSDREKLSQRLVEFLPEGGSNAGAETTGDATTGAQAGDQKAGGWPNLAVGIGLGAVMLILQMNGWLF
jgi:hypothetical protein